MERKRIGLREVRSLRPGEIVWDATVAGFAARRQKGDAVAYVLKYRTAEGRQRWHTIGRHGAPGRPTRLARKLNGCSARRQRIVTRRPRRKPGARGRPLPS